MLTLNKPHISEKSMGATAYQVYTFKVDAAASKGAIAEAVEKTFKVNVVKVRTIRQATRSVRLGRTGKYKTVRGFKKALVTLAPKQTISYFSTDKK